MELGLSLCDKTQSKATENKTLGFCMALGINPLDHETKEKHEHNQDQDHDDDDDVETDDDSDQQHNEQSLKDVSVSGQIVSSSMNPPVQLDLLPSAPVPRHASFRWSSYNGSDGGPSGPVEEATSSFRLEFMSYGGNGNSESHKRGFEMGNDAVFVERGSSRVSDEDEHGMMSRKKLRLSKEQSAYLEESFKEHSTLNPVSTYVLVFVCVKHHVLSFLKFIYLKHFIYPHRN